MSNRWDSSVEEQKLNKIENEFGSSMTEEEVAKHFNESFSKTENEKIPKTKEEFEELENKQINDIYKISARVKNLARGDRSLSLTPVGEILCNSYTHVLKSLYDYAERIKDDKLIELIRYHEKMPSDVIAASVGVNKK